MWGGCRCWTTGSQRAWHRPGKRWKHKCKESCGGQRPSPNLELYQVQGEDRGANMRHTGGVGVAGRAGERAGGMTMMVRNLSHWHMAVPRLELSISPGEGVAIE